MQSVEGTLKGTTIYIQQLDDIPNHPFAILIMVAPAMIFSIIIDPCGERELYCPMDLLLQIDGEGKYNLYTRATACQLKGIKQQIEGLSTREF